jgi:hypothetical protein
VNCDIHGTPLKQSGDRLYCPACEKDAPKKPSKYGNTICYHEGEKFDSKWELEYWLILKMREKAGEITDLQRQVKIPLRASGGKIVSSYIADFGYFSGKEPVYEDAKGQQGGTPLFKLKKKWVEAEYGVIIREVYKNGETSRKKKG